MFPTVNTLGLVFNNGHILLERFNGAHVYGTGIYYRPIGGKIEYGETSQIALTREFHEELNADVIVERYLKCIENIFRIGTEISHEVTQVYIVRFHDKSLYINYTLEVVEGVKKSTTEWVPLSDLLSGKDFLYPDELKEIISRELPSCH